ncbi:MAG: RHS repeat protein [Bacteroidales bacterium]|nr:RHS repeat protein [Bacteroidales bacterium]
MKQSHNILVSFGINDSLRKWAVQASGQPFVYFNYNPVGDNTKVYSAVANDWERNYTYDLLGRRLTYTEGELAESYTYNGGNLASHSQSWTENNQQQTKTTTYHYNAHRLDSVSYEDALTTIYHYDQYGRVDSLYDESGVMCYEYGNMGEITKETRIYALPFLSQPIALTTQFRYDSWGRVDSIFYPDGERLNYRYDLGGQLQSVSNNSSYTYLDNVSYDRFGAKLHQEYGNGLVTDYDYDNTTRRLSQITVTDNSNNPYSDIQYTYDPVGNVTQVASSYSWTQGQAFTEAFAYDASDQLVSAAETQAQCYQLEVGYGDWGRIDDYSLLHTELWSGATTHDHRSFAYPNDPYNPQQAQTLFAPETHNGTSDVTYTFGINGSLRKREEHSPNPCTEYYLFNSAANLKAYSYDGLDFAYYGYNASNTRTYKLSMLNTNQWVNGQPEPLDLQLQSAMFYPNAYLNFNCKHPPFVNIPENRTVEKWTKSVNLPKTRTVEKRMFIRAVRKVMPNGTYDDVRGR